MSDFVKTFVSKRTDKPNVGADGEDRSDKRHTLIDYKHAGFSFD